MDHQRQLADLGNVEAIRRHLRILWTDIVLVKKLKGWEDHDSPSSKPIEREEFSLEAIHQSFIAPIHRLPPELLALVFSFFCTVDFWDWEPFQRKTNRTGGSIFREPFMIATIELSREDWEDYETDPNIETEADEPQTFPEDVLEVALELSAQHPLKLWIECFRDYAYWPSIFTTKLQVFPRIEQLDLAGESDPFHGGADSPDLVFNRLSAVQVHPFQESRSVEPLLWLLTATNVRLLILQNLDEAKDGFWSSMPVQSTQIRLFTELFSFADAISTFSKFLHILSSRLMSRYSHYDHPLVSESLQTLHSSPYSDETEICQCYCFENIFSNLTLPALQNLQIKGDAQYPASWSQPHFSEFLDRSAIRQRLISLSLDDIGLNEPRAWESVPCLTRLTVSRFDKLKRPIIGTPVLQQLNSKTLLPRLRFFDMWIEDAEDTIEAVVGFVRARTPPRGCLEEIVVRMKELSETDQLLEEGMESFLEIRYTTVKA
ncbi:hypothetical protein C8J56DRAFT_1059511 [Mycena floridula]|nr:hypothetical protein C8J56DRAFT_1059511 [Mycena floridula]